MKVRWFADGLAEAGFETVDDDLETEHVLTVPGTLDQEGGKAGDVGEGLCEAGKFVLEFGEVLLLNSTTTGGLEGIAHRVRSKHLPGVVNVLFFESCLKENSHHMIHENEGTRTEVAPLHQKADNPGMCAKAIHRRLADETNLVLPAEITIGDLDGGEDMVDHSIEKIAFVLDMVVQRHRLDLNGRRQFPHRHLLDAVPIGKRNRSLDDPLPGKRCSGVGGHFLTLSDLGLDSAYSVRICLRRKHTVYAYAVRRTRGDTNMALGTEALARASATRPWRTVVVWLTVLVTAGLATAALLGEALTTSIEFTDDPDSAVVMDLIEEVRGEPGVTEFIVVTSETTTINDPVFMAYVNEIQTTLADSAAAESVGSYLTETGPVSESGNTALLPVQLAGENVDDFADNAATLREQTDAIAAPNGFESLIAGPASINNDFNHVAEEDLRTGEAIGIVVALIVLVFVFGSVASGVVPIILGVVSIATALGLAALVGQVFDLSFFITNMISMIGLAVGIDYSLFIVSRYREERQKGFLKIDAIGRAGATASRAVFFSGMTVVLALVGMLLVPNTLFRALGLGAILVVISAVIASMTLLPAVLSLMGDRIDSLRVRRRGSLETQGRFWDRVTKTVMGRPVMSLVISTALLLFAASSVFSINTGMAGVSTMPDEIESARAFHVLEREFAGGLASPVEIAIRGADVERTLADLQEALASDSRFGPLTVDPESNGDLAIVSVQLPGDVSSGESMETVSALRNEIVPEVISGETAVFVGGQTAVTLDLVSQTSEYTPIVFAVVLGLSFLLLTVAFRSIVIPVKAIAMNLLSVGAAYGLVVAFFQIGVGPGWIKDIASFFGFTQADTIEAWIPLFLFSVLFGLSMDYHVFLLSRIKERFDQTRDNTASVTYGLRTTGSLITGAAAIMVAVFAGFAAGRLTSFQQMGFGLAVAVLLDATIIRTVLVPASMRLLGDWNWYFPKWLEWIPNVSVEGQVDDSPASAEPELISA